MTAPSDRGRRPRLPEGPAGHGAAGVGLDLVHVPGLVEQVTRPGTVFAERVFTARERREARRRSEDTGSTEAEHLAARWAAKEAFIKAWSQALNTRAGGAYAPGLGTRDGDGADMAVVTDPWAVETSLGEGSGRPGAWPVSLTHDGDWAAAIVLAVTSP